MQVGLNSSKTVATTQQSSTKDLSKENQTARDANSIAALASSKLDSNSIKELSNIGGKAITQAYVMQFQQQSLMASMNNFNSQNSILGLGSGSDQAALMLSQIDFASIGYTGKNPLAMNSDELNALISEDGFFGVTNTANRIADFVINGAGDDLEKLQKGFEGMKRGFAEAERMWGGSLPQISQQTIDKAIEKVSARIEELGGKAVNINA